MSKSSMKLNDVLLLDTVRKLEVSTEGVASSAVFKDLMDRGCTVVNRVLVNRLAYLSRHGKLYVHRSNGRNRYGTLIPVINNGFNSKCSATRWLYRDEGAFA